MSNEINISVFGSLLSGKTCLVERFCYGTYEENYIETIEDIHIKSFEELYTEPYIVKITDTSGSDKHLHLRDLQIKKSDGIILVYSIGDYASLSNAIVIYELILKIRDVNFPIILCGTMSDKFNRDISVETGIKTAFKFYTDFIEVSAKLDTNVKECFRKLISTIIEKREKEKVDSDARKCCSFL